MSSPTFPERPAPKYLNVILLRSFLLGPFFFVAFIPAYLRYKSTSYSITEEGVSMRWGILSRTEVNLTFRRIQDIHVQRGLLERWFGLGSIALQTASGSAGAEMTLYGLLNYDELRDFFYSRMRGASGNKVNSAATTSGVAGQSESVMLLKEMHGLLQSINSNLGDRRTQ